MSGTLHVLVPGDIEARTGGYGYDRRVMAELRALGWDVRHVALPALGPGSGRDAEAETAAALARLPDGALVLVDGLAYALMPRTAEAEAARLRLVALVHHPLALETGLDPAVAAELRDSEARALVHARAVVVTSPATAETLVANYAVARARLTIALPGTDPAPPRAPPAGPPVILSIGSLIPRKGHDVLLDALALLLDLDWRCRIVGGDALDPAWAADLRDQAARLGLKARVAFVGGVVDPSAEYAGAHLFALPSRYEGYGMVFAEALANGLPIVAARAGAVPDVVPETAGLLVPPDDAPRLAAALRRLIGNPAERTAFAAGAAHASEALPRWPDTAAVIARAMREAAS